MPEQSKRITPSDVLRGESPLVLTATLAPVAGQDRFQPAGFPEVGHVIYKAPRTNGTVEAVAIVDSPASMANHLEAVCMRGPHDLDLVDDLAGMPYLRCVTDEGWPNVGKEKGRPAEVVVTSLTEGHRIASTYFLGGRNKKSGKWDGKGAQRVLANGTFSKESFGDELANEFGVVLPESSRAHPPASKWWNVFESIFKYDPNALVHGVMFPQWQIKIARVLTAHLEAFGAARVDRSGVKFDRLGKTTSGQPIFAVDDATAREIRATFVLDLALLQSFGRKDELGLGEKQKEFLVALALWKVRCLLATPFRFRSGCQLECVSLKHGKSDAEIEVNMKQALKDAAFGEAMGGGSVVTEVYWPADELYREAKETPDETGDAGDDADTDGHDEDQ